jgi:MSHA biogenesis protein MshP
MGLAQARALAAARAGIEWGAYRALNGSCAASTTLNLSEAALSGFAVTVSCTSTAFTNGAVTSQSYTVTSTAISGLYGRPDYVRRVFSSTFTDAS